eukprot:2917057-Pyramimonas_sp.AAC.1
MTAAGVPGIPVAADPPAGAPPWGERADRDDSCLAGGADGTAGAVAPLQQAPGAVRPKTGAAADKKLQGRRARVLYNSRADTRTSATHASER